MKKMLCSAAIAALCIVGTTTSAAGQSEPVSEPVSESVSEPMIGPPVPEELLRADAALAAADAPEAVPDPLAQAVAIATGSHPVVRRAVADEQVSESELRGAKWQRFPSFSVDALAVTRGNENSSQNGIAANLVLEQPLWTFGQIRNNIQRARSSLEASGHNIDDVQQQIALRTIGAYYNLALATKRAEILKDSLRQHERLLETISRRVEQEVSPRADLELAGSRAAQIEQDLAAVAGLRATAYSQLMELVGYADLDLGSVPAFDPDMTIPSQTELVGEAIACSPLLAGLRSQLDAVEAQRKVARSRLFPQLLGQATHNEITGTRVGVTVRLQTGNGLSRFSDIDAAAAQVVSAEYDISSAERDIREQVRSDYLTYEAGRNRSFASERATRSSDLVTASYQRQFITGRRTWLDVMNAVRESMTAKLTEADAQLAAMSAYSRLMIQSCRWQPAPIRQEEEYQ